MSSRAWVTLATNDSYGLGALVLAHSLRRAGSAYPTVVLITPSVTEAMRDRLGAVFAEVVTVDVLDSGDAAHLALLQRPELGITFTKIHCWNLTQFDKCVFLDADTLVVQNCDELFEREELSAAPDVGWPDCFNSGVFVFKPSAETFSSLIKFAQERGSFDGGDQGLLNSYFSDWAHGDINKHLPFLYNVTSAAFYSYLPALKHYGQNLKIIHFIGAAKPWLQQFNWESRSVDAPEHLRELLQLWWDLFVSQVHSQLDTTMVEVEDVPTAITPPQESIFHTEPTSDYNNYKPVLDPDSEFRWHRPDAQIPDTEVIVPQIDMTQFHDPWDIYRGHIRPLTEKTKSTCSYSLNLNEQQEIRRHVWEHPASQQFKNSIEEPHYTEPHDTESLFTPVYYNETHYNKDVHTLTHYNEFYNNATNYNEFHQDRTHNNQYYQNTINQNEFHHNLASQNETCGTGTQFNQNEPFSAQTHHVEHIQDTFSRSDGTQSNKHYDFHQNQYQYRENFPVENPSHGTEIQSSYDYNYDRQSFSDYSVPSYRNESIEYHSNREYNRSENSDRCQSEPDRRQESLSFHQHYTPISEFHSNNQYEFSLSTQNKDQEENSTREENFNNNGDINNETYYTNINNTVFNSEPQVNKKHITSHHLQKLPEDFIHPLRNKVEYVYCLYLDHERERNRQREKLKIPTTTTQEKVNGFDAETEIDDIDNIDDDFIIPRHPYDGFYLRHRMTIDSRGRKICTHEIPPTPSPSPSISPPGSPVYFDAISESSSQEDKFLEAISDEHSGVAGNLARVSADPSGLQREALDELSRRQGWEAGNIDYMGADSFDNIWAKISQTLSQAPASPPKEPTPPPKELDLQQVEAPEAKEPEALTLPDQKLIEEAPVVAEPSKESTLTVEESNKDEVSAVAAALVDVSAPVDTPAETIQTSPSEVSVPLEVAEKPIEDSSPEVAVPTGTTDQEGVLSSPKEAVSSPQEAEPVLVDTSALVEVSKSADAIVSEEASVPVETADVPAESLVPDLPAEIPVPVVEAVLAEAKSPIDETAIKPEEVPAPVIEASAEDVPKEESSAATIAKVVQEEKSEEIPKASEEAPKEESPKDVVPEPISSEAPQPMPVIPTPESPAAGTEIPSTPTKPVDVSGASDSPPLANTPSTEDIPTEPAAKAEERRKPAGKLQLRPPAAADPLPTPDSELEDAATLAQSIIASELRTPTVTSPTPQTPASPAQPKQETRLAVEEPHPQTPPVGSVSLSQIGVKAAKGKSTIAAQIESSVSDKPAPASPTTELKAPTDAPPKKKVVKKVLKKDSAASGEAPVPPPRKKEKKPKEK